MNKKGQGALEYLLLIGGALIVAAIVLTILPGLAEKGGASTEDAAWAASCAPYQDLATCENAMVMGSTTTNYHWDAGSAKCLAGPLAP